MRRRLRGLSKVRTLLRRRFFFWQMQRSIWRKRAACRVITDQLTNNLKLSKAHRMIKQFAFGVKRIQRRWRERQIIQAAQMEACRHGWVRADMARGLSKTAALHVEKGDLEMRLQVIKDDLVVRKRLFGRDLKVWAKLQAKYEAWKAEQEMMASALALMVGEGGSPGRSLNVLEAYDPLSVPPLKPTFSIIGPANNYVVLAKRLVELRQSIQQAKNRQWAAQDRTRVTSGALV